ASSVALWPARARSPPPTCRWAAETAAAAAGICRGLAGFPLPIGPAAARLPSLPPRAMLDRMAHCLPLLTGGPRDAPARQQTLRSTIAWSYDLLSPDEQVLFRRLAVFRGCTIEPIEAVCAAPAAQPGATSIALPPLP